MPSSASCGRGSLPSRSVPARDWRLRIEDILAAVERVQRYAAGMDLASFLADEKTVDAVSFCFGVMARLRPHSRGRGRRQSRPAMAGDARHAERRGPRILWGHAGDSLEDSARGPPSARRATASLAGRALR